MYRPNNDGRAYIGIRSTPYKEKPIYYYPSGGKGIRFGNNIYYAPSAHANTMSPSKMMIICANVDAADTSNNIVRESGVTMNPPGAFAQDAPTLLAFPTVGAVLG